MPIWVSIATGLGGVIIGAILQYMRDRKIIARSEGFRSSLVNYQGNREQEIAEWQQQCQKAIASTSIRNPGGKEIPPFPSLSKFEPPSPT